MTRRIFPPSILPKYDSLSRINTMKRIKILLFSKTVIGAVLGAAAYLVGLDHIDANAVLQAAGPVLAAVGVRDAMIPGR